MARLGTSDRPLRVAIVGAGPAGLYAAQADRRMSIPGEDLPNSHPAISFVGWYNGHPDYRDLEVDLDCERVVVVGNGQRGHGHDRHAGPLPRRAGPDRHGRPRPGGAGGQPHPRGGDAGPPRRRPGLLHHPRAARAGQAGGGGRGRRPGQHRARPGSKAGIENDRAARANLRHLQDYAARAERTAPRRITLRFLASPVELLGSGGRVEAVRIERNELVVDHNGGLRSKGTGEFEVIEAGLVLRSIGYRTVPIEGVPFDPATSTVNTIAGQITHPNSGEVTPGEYVAGWAKRGPTGRMGP